MSKFLWIPFLFIWTNIADLICLLLDRLLSRLIIKLMELRIKNEEEDESEEVDNG